MTLPRVAHLPALLVLALAAGAGVRLTLADRATQPLDLLLLNATILDGTAAPARHGAFVSIRDGRIQQVGDMPSLGGQSATRVIDLKNRTVIPGFVAMHEHVTFLGPERKYDADTSRAVLRILLSHGITTVRNPAAPTREGVELRREVAAGTTPGPRIFTAGWMLDDPRLSADRLREEIDRQAKSGVDFIKLYAGLPPPLVRVAIAHAHRHGLPVIGHLQRTTWTEAAASGIDFITHGAPWSVEYLPADKRTLYEEAIAAEGPIKARIRWLEWVQLDSPAIKRMIRTLIDRRVSIDPTLVAYDTKFRGDLPHYTNGADARLVPGPMAESWRRGTFVDDWSPEDFRRGHTVWPKVLALTRLLFDSGVRLTAGSDVPNPGVVPGAGFHRELELLVDAGIPPAHVLRIATANGAEALGELREFGTIAVGKRADLVVLRDSPLEDIRNTRHIDHVFLGGTEIEQPAAAPSASQGTEECFVLAAPGRAEVVSDARECGIATSPASTFKIPHALIALQTGVIAPATVVRWDGTAYDFATWRREHTLESAIRWSVYPFFQRTARSIGRERMRQSLAALGYSSDSFDGDLTTFWNTGDLLVTPVEQVRFLRRLAAGTLPVDARHIATVRASLRMPAGEITNAAGTHRFALDWPDNSVVYAKTGNTTVDGERASWLVGWVTAGSNETVFAARARARGALEGTAGAQVALRGLNHARAAAGGGR